MISAFLAIDVGVLLLAARLGGGSAFNHQLLKREHVVGASGKFPNGEDIPSVAAARFGRDSIQYRVGKTNRQDHHPSKRVPIFIEANSKIPRSRHGGVSDFGFSRIVWY